MGFPKMFAYTEFSTVHSTKRSQQLIDYNKQKEIKTRLTMICKALLF